ncbi:MAG: hypothetical protein JXO44_15165 [Clostridia bacterium]|nr:hypothetical protein [Clostridia bacterium]
MSRIGAIVLSRYSSTRLPGKALMEIENKKILEYIIERLQTVLPLHDIVIATSDEDSDNQIECFCQERGIRCYRGDLDDVAKRFYDAARFGGFDYAIRINGDNVLIDTDVLKDMIDICKTKAYDFLSNVKGRTFPKGMSVEIVNVPYYEALLDVIETSDYFKEHVMVYLYEHGSQERHYYYMNTTFPEAAGIQFALDTKEDFENIRRIISKFKRPHFEYNMKEIFEIWKENTCDHKL